MGKVGPDSDLKRAEREHKRADGVLRQAEHNLQQASGALAREQIRVDGLRAMAELVREEADRAAYALYKAQGGV